jgi:hypothetical protein
MKYLQLSSNKMTVLVVMDEKDIIIGGAPVIRRFMGQPLGNLVRWMSLQGGFRRFSFSSKVSQAGTT